MSNRIPGKELEEYRSWRAPALGEQGKVLPSAEKEARKKYQQRKSGANEVIGEPLKQLSTEPMTAEKLAAISETAYQDGFDKGKQEGRDVGYGDGYAKGEEKALEETRNKIEAQSALLQHLITGITDPFEKETQKLESFMVDTVTALVRAVVIRELTVDSTHIKTLVEKALDALPNTAGSTRVFVNATDKEYLEQHFPNDTMHWELFVADDLEAGGCRVETTESEVDYSVATRLNTLCDAFIKGELH